MEQALESHHRKSKTARVRRRRPPRRYLDPTEAPNDEDDEVEIGGGAPNDKPPSAARGHPMIPLAEETEGTCPPRDGQIPKLVTGCAYLTECLG